MTPNNNHTRQTEAKTMHPHAMGIYRSPIYIVALDSIRPGGCEAAKFFILVVAQ
jgi:hypothetical protein